MIIDKDIFTIDLILLSSFSDSELILFWLNAWFDFVMLGLMIIDRLFMIVTKALLI